MQSNNQNEQSVNKLQGMIQILNHKQENDPEMDQLGGMLDKILDIQHPDRVQVRSKKNQKE